MGDIGGRGARVAAAVARLPHASSAADAILAELDASGVDIGEGAEPWRWLRRVRSGRGFVLVGAEELFGHEPVGVDPELATALGDICREVAGPGLRVGPASVGGNEVEVVRTLAGLRVSPAGTRLGA